MEKLFLVVLLLLACCGLSQAQYSKLQGIVGLGGQTVTVSGITSSTKHLKTYGGASVTVYLAGTITLATIYSDETGTPKANPFTSSSTDASWSFYALPGRYDVKFIGGGIGTPFTLGDFNIGDGATGHLVMNCFGTNDTSMLATASSTGRVIVIPKDETCASNSQTISAAFQVDNGGLLKPLNSQTVTLTGPQPDGPWQRFTNATAGLGTISLVGNTHIREIYPQWWGAAGTGLLDDTLPLNATLAQAGQKVFIPKGRYQVTAALSVPNSASISGAGRDITILEPTAAVTTFVLKIKSGTVLVENFWIKSYGDPTLSPSTATSSATGIIFGDQNNFDSWGGKVTQIRVSNFLGAGGVGIRFADVQKTEVDGVLTDYNNVGVLFKQLCTVPPSIGCGFPTTVTVRNSQTVNGVQGVKIIDGHGIILDGQTAESNQQEGIIVIPTGTADGILVKGSTWLESNWASGGVGQFQFLVDGTNGTAQVDVEDTYFTAVGPKSLRFTGANTRGCSINRLHVPDIAGTVIAEAGVTGTVISWERNIPTTGFSNAGRTGTTPTTGFEFAQGPYTTWTPTFSSDIGNAAATFNGAVTVAEARFLLIGKRLYIKLEWSATLKAVTPNYIVISLPTGVMTLSGVPLSTGAGENNGLWEIGKFRGDGASNLQQFRQQNNNYTASGLVGGEFNGIIELQ